MKHSFILIGILLVCLQGVCQVADSLWSKKCCSFPFQILETENRDTVAMSHQPCNVISWTEKGSKRYILIYVCDSTLGITVDFIDPELLGSQINRFYDSSGKCISEIDMKHGIVKECYTFIYDSLGRVLTQVGFIDGNPVKIDFYDYDPYGSYKKVVTTTAEEQKTLIYFDQKDKYGNLKTKTIHKKLKTTLTTCQ